MIAGILQPGYLPWLGFFEQVYRSDVFVIYDDVQYDRNGWRNRNRIKTHGGGPQWLTVPVNLDFSARPRINQVTVDNRGPWSRKHRTTLRQSYAGAPYERAYRDLFEEAFSHTWDRLLDLDMFFIRRLTDALGMKRDFVLSSELGVAGETVDRLIAICRHLGADTFYEGAAGRTYIDPERFREHGIRVEFQEYRHPTYPQQHGAFVPYLSVVDLLFNCGEESLAILRGKDA